MYQTLPLSGVIDAAEFYSKTRRGFAGCLEWTGSISAEGYGRFYRDGHEYRAHRVALALARGELPAGLPLDHLCRNRRCVEVAHLEVVTAPENTARGQAPTALAIRARDAGHCINGHLIAEVGTHRNGHPRGTCAQCGRDRVRKYNDKRAAVTA